MGTVHLSRSSLHLIMHLILTVVTLSAPILARNLYNDDDYFTELTSGDRQARALGLDFPQLDESFGSPAHTRQERDGGFHGGNHRGGRGGFGQHEAGRQGRQGGNRRQQGENRRQGGGRRQNFEESDFVDEDRQGRQSGDVGVALGVLNNPPREDGAYNFNFANDDGSSRQEVGNPDSSAMTVSGSYSFFTPEGELVEMQYTADENGYHASGSHMPTTPPPPPHVQRLLDHLAKVNGAFVY